MKVIESLRPAVALLALGLPAVGLANACLLSPAELQTKMGRAFNAGQQSEAVDGSALCSYTEVANPKRSLRINVIESQAAPRFERTKRLLTMGNKSIDLAGVGDAAYYNGTTAAVLSGDRLVVISNVKPPPGSKPSHHSPEEMVALLKAAIERLPK
ncbi:hypothetical protein JM946_18550 [Steroidobacter sp. S1-65]|uniref:DUF3558 domain-containing protein n=1 Tax=Steroidobacter gossypii TaxID=2805490 RepID=A0ABS1X0M4_9GAMM|nr:hypothetical protein [Steroidobacter gossypii]MBM0106737.1 hypothetical protein [Steroidobacter gossypii]